MKKPAKILIGITGTIAIGVLGYFFYKKFATTDPVGGAEADPVSFIDKMGGADVVRQKLNDNANTVIQKSGLTQAQTMQNFLKNYVAKSTDTTTVSNPAAVVSSVKNTTTISKPAAVVNSVKNTTTISKPASNVSISNIGIGLKLNGFESYLM